MCSRVRSLIIGVRVDCFTVCKTPLSVISFDRLRNHTVAFVPHLCGNRGSEGGSNLHKLIGKRGRDMGLEPDPGILSLCSVLKASLHLPPTSAFKTGLALLGPDFKRNTDLINFFIITNLVARLLCFYNVLVLMSYRK